jgi:hypothetical protein
MSAVAKPEKNHLWRRASKHAQSMEVFVLCDEDAVAFFGDLPDSGIGRTAGTKRPHVQRLREGVLQQRK